MTINHEHAVEISKRVTVNAVANTMVHLTPTKIESN